MHIFKSIKCNMYVYIQLMASLNGLMSYGFQVNSGNVLFHILRPN